MNDNIPQPGEVSAVPPNAPATDPEQGATQPANRKPNLFLAGLAVFLIVAGLGVGAYAYFAPVSPEKAMRKMVAASDKVEQVAFDATADVDVNMETGESITLGFTASGRGDFTDDAEPAIDGSFSASGEGLVLRSDFRLLMGDFYLRLVEVPFLGFFDAGSIENQWIKFDHETLSQELGFDISQDLTAEQRNRIEDAFMEFQPLSLGEKIGNENISGTSVRVFPVVIEKPKLLSYLRRVAEIQGTSDPEYFSSLTESLSGIEFANGEIWLGKKDYLPYRMKMDMLISLPEQGTSGTVSVDVSMKDYGVPVQVEAPADAVPVEEIFGSLFGGGFGETGEMIPAESIMAF